MLIYSSIIFNFVIIPSQQHALYTLNGTTNVIEMFIKQVFALDCLSLYGSKEETQEY